MVVLTLGDVRGQSGMMAAPLRTIVQEKASPNIITRGLKNAAIGQVTDDHANRVIAKLEKSFEVVTILEEMELNTPEILNRAFGWSLSFPLTKANPSQHKLAFTSEQEAFVRQLNTHDYKVYNHFKAKPPNRRGLTKTLD